MVLFEKKAKEYENETGLFENYHNFLFYEKQQAAVLKWVKEKKSLSPEKIHMAKLIVSCFETLAKGFQMRTVTRFTAMFLFHFYKFEASLRKIQETWLESLRTDEKLEISNEKKKEFL
jgi:hypothetical protein